MEREEEPQYSYYIDRGGGEEFRDEEENEEFYESEEGEGEEFRDEEEDEEGYYGEEGRRLWSWRFGKEFHSEFLDRLSHYPLIEYLSTTGYKYYNDWKNSNRLLRVFFNLLESFLRIDYLTILFKSVYIG